MQPTIGDGNYILVSKYSAGIRCPQNIFEIPWINIIGYYLLPNKYVNTILHAKKTYKRLKRPHIKRNDIIIFNMPYYLSSIGIKRCIGMPGDSIKYYSLKNELLPVIPYKGMKVSTRNYSKAQQDTLKHFFLFQNVKGKDELISTMNFYFVQGDNKEYSIDSRTWGILPEDHIFAKFLFCLF